MQTFGLTLTYLLTYLLTLLIEGKKKLTSKETVLVRITKKKKKKRLKVMLTPNNGTLVIKNLSFNVSSS
jgi:hypothetical protein